MLFIMDSNIKTLTVFTPSYNRSGLLLRVYESLGNQSFHNFIWLIVDDGSTDNTSEIVKNWISCTHSDDANDCFEGYSKDYDWLYIKYIYKKNGGLHTGYNKAIELIDTELCICIDSDDYMPSDAVCKIIDIWNSIEDKSDVAGIVALDYYDSTMTPIGGFFSKDKIKCHLMDIGSALNHSGDTKIVCRTDLMKQHWPMLVFEGEKNFNPFYYYLKIDEHYYFYVVNVNFCFVDYQETGMTANIFRQFKNSPRSFACYREEIMRQKRLPLKLRFRNAIHFGSSIIYTNEYKRLFEFPSPFLKILAFPMSIILHIYVNYKAK